ncbi:MAG: glucose-1-phosphate adenylyltransferase subunit GlgD [bacterium]
MKDVLGIIMTFDKATELKDLTDHRTVASIPFGSRYRLIDFMLSNMVNSNINQVGVMMRDNYQSLIEHIGTGKEWDLSRKIGGIRLIPPYSYSKKSHLFDITERKSKIEGLIGAYSFIKKNRAEYVVLSDANIVTNIDLEKVVNYHVEQDADITCVCVPKDEPNENDTYFELDKNENLKNIYLSIDPNNKCKHTALGIYVLKKELLETLVQNWANKNFKNFELEGLNDALKNYNLKAYVHDTFSAQITDVKRYFDANMKLLSKDVRDELFIKNRAIYTKVYDEQPTYYSDKAYVCDSLIADGCVLEGTVENSIISRDVHIKKGAVVRNSIVLQSTIIREDANILNVISDKSVKLGKGKTMMGQESFPIVITKGSVI